MAEKGGQDLFSKLADRGEEVIGRINDLNIPGSQKLVESANQLRDRVDELQRKVRGLDALERRVDALEKKVDELSRASGGTKPAATTKRTTPAKKPKAES